MKKNAFLLKLSLSLIVLFLICSTGCSNKSKSPADDTPFRQAIVKYLADHSYGMTIASIEKITVENNEAVVISKMREAEGLYALTVKWTFFCKKENTVWTVIKHKT